MKTWSIPIGRIFDVELRLHFAFFFLLLFVVAFNQKAGVATGLTEVAMIVLAVFLHELSHIYAAHSRGIPVRMIMLLPIGGIHIRESADAPISPNTEIAIALAGPLASFTLAAFAAAASSVVHPDLDLLARPLLSSGVALKAFLWANAGIGALNLIPAYPLDGGRILRALFVQASKDLDPQSTQYTATRRALTIGQVFATFLIFAGIWQPWLMLTRFFRFLAVQMEERAIMFHSVMDSVRLEDVMLTDFSTLSPADTLEDALSKAVHSLQDDFPVVRGGDMVGVISKQRILQTLREEGNGYVQSAMYKVFETAKRQESLTAAFRKITSRRATVIPIVDDERLVGIVTLQNLMHSMGLLAETRRMKRAAE